MPTTEAWARWAEPNASQTKISSHKRGELLRKLGIVGFFFGMKADILKKQHFPIAKRFAFCHGVRSDAVRGKLNGLAEQLASDSAATGARLYFGSDFAFRPAEMRSQHQTRAAIDCQAQRGQSFADTSVVRDFASHPEER